MANNVEWILVIREKNMSTTPRGYASRMELRKVR